MCATKADSAQEFISTILTTDELTNELTYQGSTQTSPTTTDDSIRSLINDFPGEKAITEEAESEAPVNGFTIEQFIDSISVDDRQLMIETAAHCFFRRKSHESLN